MLCITKTFIVDFLGTIIFKLILNCLISVIAFKIVSKVTTKIWILKYVWNVNKIVFNVVIQMYVNNVSKDMFYIMENVWGVKDPVLDVVMLQIIVYSVHLIKCFKMDDVMLCV